MAWLYYVPWAPVLFILLLSLSRGGHASAGNINSNRVDTPEDQLWGAFSPANQLRKNTEKLIFFKSGWNSKPFKDTDYAPGDTAHGFQVKTLDGDFVYPPPGGLNISIIVHAFTNKSAFLECMWTSDSSLTDLVDNLPDSAHVVFVSLDDTAEVDVHWMRYQIQRVAKQRKKDILDRLHFSSVPVYSLGNWIPSVLYDWRCEGINCGLNQAVFTSKDWDTPIVAKRLDARYDWLMGHWSRQSYELVDAADGCNVSSEVKGAVAWVSEGDCSFFTKVKNMAESQAVGVVVYASLGRPIQDMTCVGIECYTPLSIPASMVHLLPAVMSSLRSKKQVNVSFQNTPSPNFFFGIDHEGKLAEMGWFLYPTFKFLTWQSEWFDYVKQLYGKLQKPARAITVFNHTVMQGENGTVTTVELPKDFLASDSLELDASLSCPGLKDETCAPWDHTVQLYVCCDGLSQLCNLELGRWITAFHRGIGRWLTDVSPLMPLLNSTKCTFSMKTVPWAKPWVASLNLRFGKSSHSDFEKHSGDLSPYLLKPLYNGGTFDKNYNKKYQPVNFTVPTAVRKVEIYAVITGHGSDDNGCGEFCVTSHHFLINSKFNHSKVFEKAGTAFGCAEAVKEGVVPNEHGTWLYGRGGWCDGLQVTPWRIDITSQLNMNGSNTILYFGLFDGKDPNPARDPGYIIMWS
uniref:Si:dkey-256h2.1 n=1 Tax=Lepisosteus oculatus TaxID=7918 RepID=W5MYS9_LEPOC